MFVALHNLEHSRVRFADVHVEYPIAVKNTNTTKMKIFWFSEMSEIPSRKKKKKKKVFKSSKEKFKILLINENYTWVCEDNTGLHSGNNLLKTVEFVSFSASNKLKKCKFTISDNCEREANLMRNYFCLKLFCLLWHLNFVRNHLFPYLAWNAKPIVKYKVLP